MGRSFAGSVASGYVAIAVQAVTGILLVPFLISSHGVGLQGFGGIATIQALAAALSVLLDGHRQESARRVALAVTGQGRSCLAALLVVTAGTAVVLAGAGALLAHPLTEFVQLRIEDAAAAWWLACAAFVFEQLSYVLESNLHAARRNLLAHALGAADAVMRAVLTVSFFWLLAPSPVWFFLAALLSVSLKVVVLAIISRRSLGGGVDSSALGEELRVLRRSAPLALNGIAPFLVFRLTVILGNRYLGSQQAGVLSIILVTLRTYLNQAVFSALRPILLARLAGTGWSERSTAARQAFVSRLLMYRLAVCGLGIALACATPIWLPLWLGAALQQYTGYFAVMLSLFAAEVAYGIPYYWLVANGHARRLALVNGVTGTLVGVAVVLAAWVGASMVAFTSAVAVYLTVYMMAVGYEFRRWFGVLSERTRSATSAVSATIDGAAR